MADSMKSLVIFVAILAIAGAAIGGACYAVIDLPQQNTALQPPENSPSNVKCLNCMLKCKYAPNYYECLSDCDLIC